MSSSFNVLLKPYIFPNLLFRLYPIVV